MAIIRGGAGGIGHGAARLFVAEGTKALCLTSCAPEQ